MKANATRVSVYAQIHTNKYIEHVPTKPTKRNITEKGTHKYENGIFNFENVLQTESLR